MLYNYNVFQIIKKKEWSSRDAAAVYDFFDSLSGIPFPFLERLVLSFGNITDKQRIKKTWNPLWQWIKEIPSIRTCQVRIGEGVQLFSLKQERQSNLEFRSEKLAVPKSSFRTIITVS